MRGWARPGYACLLHGRAAENASLLGLSGLRRDQSEGEALGLAAVATRADDRARGVDGDGFLQLSAVAIVEQVFEAHKAVLGRPAEGAALARWVGEAADHGAVFVEGEAFIGVGATHVEVERLATIPADGASGAGGVVRVADH